ncbi:MAG: hypothetical protein GX166_06215 [Clostridiaceae bacterium]|nr:hypothetical protein [Clostridiaceae bacterium]
MPENILNDNCENSPEVVRVSPLDNPYDSKPVHASKKKKSGGIGSVIENILDRIKQILSRFLGREVGTDDLLLLGLILVLFLEKRNKNSSDNEDIDLLLIVLLYLLIS